MTTTSGTVVLKVVELEIVPAENISVLTESKYLAIKDEGLQVIECPRL